MVDDFMKVVQCKLFFFVLMFLKVYQEFIVKNRYVLLKVIEVILFCSCQNIFFRGYREDYSNFYVILYIMVKIDVILVGYFVFLMDVKYIFFEI